MHKIHFKNKHLKTPENILAMCVPANFDTAVGTVKQNVKKTKSTRNHKHRQDGQLQ